MTGFTFLSRLTQIAPPYTRFVFLGAGIRLGLPSHPASRRRSCLRLGVSTTSSSRGLSPPSDRPCRAYSRRRAAAPRVGACAGPLPWEARPGARRPHAPAAVDHRGSPGAQHVLGAPSSSAIIVLLPAAASRSPCGRHCAIGFAEAAGDCLMGVQLGFMGVQLGGKVIWAGLLGRGCGAGTGEQQRGGCACASLMIKRRAAATAVRPCVRPDPAHRPVVSAGHMPGPVGQAGAAASFRLRNASPACLCRVSLEW